MAAVTATSLPAGGFPYSDTTRAFMFASTVANSFVYFGASKVPAFVAVNTGTDSGKALIYDSVNSFSMGYPNINTRNIIYNNAGVTNST